MLSQSRKLTSKCWVSSFQPHWPASESLPPRIESAHIALKMPSFLPWPTALTAVLHAPQHPKSYLTKTTISLRCAADNHASHDGHSGLCGSPCQLEHACKISLRNPQSQQHCRQEREEMAASSLHARASSPEHAKIAGRADIGHLACTSPVHVRLEEGNALRIMPMMTVASDIQRFNQNMKMTQRNVPNSDSHLL